MTGPPTATNSLQLAIVGVTCQNEKSQQPNWQTHDQTEISLTLGVVSSPHKDKTNSLAEPPQASFTNKSGKSLGKYSRILTHKPTNSNPVDPHVVSISNLDVIFIFFILFQIVLYPRPSWFKTPGISSFCIPGFVISILQPSVLAVMFCSSRSMVVCHSRCLQGGGARVLDACCMSRATAKDTHMHNIQHICQKIRINFTNGIECHQTLSVFMRTYTYYW